jgi:hypothetical protein
MNTYEQNGAMNRLTEIYSEIQSLRAGTNTDTALVRRRSMLYTEMLDLQRSLIHQRHVQPAPEKTAVHDKMYLHLADEQITDAEALLAFRRRLQIEFYSDYADTLSVQILLADLSEIRLQYLRDWVDREESLGRYLSVDKSWLGYRLTHAEIHCQRVRVEMRAAQEKRLQQMQAHTSPEAEEISPE